MTMIFKEGCGQLPRVIPLRRLQQSLSPWKALDKGIFDDDDDDDDGDDDDHHDDNVDDNADEEPMLSAVDAFISRHNSCLKFSTRF